MTLDIELCFLLSDLKEHGLLDKYPALERAVRLGYQQLQANSKQQTEIYKNQDRMIEVVRQNLVSLEDSAKEKPTTRKIKCPTKMIDKEALLKDLKNFKE